VIPEGMLKSHGTKICLMLANFKSGEMFILGIGRCIIVISYAQRQMQLICTEMEGNVIRTLQKPPHPVSISLSLFYLFPRFPLSIKTALKIVFSYFFTVN